MGTKPCKLSSIAFLIKHKFCTLDYFLPFISDVAVTLYSFSNKAFCVEDHGKYIGFCEAFYIIYSAFLIKHNFCTLDYFLSYWMLQLHYTCSCNKAFYIWCRRKWNIYWILFSGFVMPDY